MIEAAAANGVKLMIAYRLHLEQGNLEAAQLAQSGELEDPRFFSSDFAQQAVENNIRVTEPVETRGEGRRAGLRYGRLLHQRRPLSVSSSACIGLGVQQK